MCKKKCEMYRKNYNVLISLELLPHLISITFTLAGKKISNSDQIQQIMQIFFFDKDSTMQDNKQQKVENIWLFVLEKREIETFDFTIKLLFCL